MSLVVSRLMYKTLSFSRCPRTMPTDPKKNIHWVQLFVAIVTLLYLCPGRHHSTPRSHDIRIALLAPRDPSRPFSLGRALPAVEVALNRLRGSVPCRFSVGYRDSQCSESHGLNEAINFYVEDQVHVFLGPVCDYAVAPVARQAVFWQVPVISVGALALDFFKRRRQVYPLLVRVGPANLRCLAESLVDIMAHFRWTKVKLLYQREGYSDVVPPFCHLASEYLVSGLKASGFAVPYFKIEEISEATLEKILLQEVGKEFSGKKATAHHKFT